MTDTHPTPNPRALRALAAGTLSFLAVACVPFVLTAIFTARGLPPILRAGRNGLAGVWVFLLAPTAALAAFVLTLHGLAEQKRRWLAFDKRPTGALAWAAALGGPLLLVLGFVFARSVLETTGLVGKLFALPAALGAVATLLGVAGVLTDLLLNSEETLPPPAVERSPEASQPRNRLERARSREERSSAGERPRSIKFRCKSCNTIGKAPRRSAGRRGRCPKCKAEVRVPSSPEHVHRSERKPARARRAA